MMNDYPMTMFLIIAMYFVMKNQPLVASFFITLSISMKAGSLLIIPAFLGSIQLNYGTRTLLKSLVIIIGF